MPHPVQCSLTNMQLLAYIGGESCINFFQINQASPKYPLPLGACFFFGNIIFLLYLHFFLRLKSTKEKVNCFISLHLIKKPRKKSNFMWFSSMENYKVLESCFCSKFGQDSSVTNACLLSSILTRDKSPFKFPIKIK